MSRGLISVKAGRTGANCGTGLSKELATTMAAGSAACAQHPQVTHVGGQFPSSSAESAKARHGSPTINRAIPVALNDRIPTIRASARRRTRRF